MDHPRCLACHQTFRPRAQCPDQAYCASPDCQRERRRRWQQHKRRTDPDYRINQAKAQRQWCERHPGYWSDYRRAHPDYAARNRAGQAARNAKRSGSKIAKNDASPPRFGLASGTYRLRPLSVPIAKSDAWTVEIIRISCTCGADPNCKETTSWAARAPPASVMAAPS